MRNARVNYGINFIVNDKIKQFKNEIIRLLEKENIHNLNYAINISDKDFIDVAVHLDNGQYFFKHGQYVYNSITELINNERIYLKLYLEHFDFTKYKRQLVDLEHKKFNQKCKLLKQYNDIFQKNFQVNNGINDIYEWYTGAVFFKDYEWEEILDNPIKKIFEIQHNNCYIYSLPLDDGIILRGANIYYYFSTDVSRFKKPSTAEIKQWFNNVNLYIKQVLDNIQNYEVKNYYDRRLLLALVDNIRNIILLLLNCELMSLYNGKDDFIYHLSYHQKAIDNYSELVEEYQQILENICLYGQCSKNEVYKVKKIYERVSDLNKKTCSKIIQIKDEFILGKCFNPLREIDNYFENYMVFKNIVEKNLIISSNQEINLITILYGGLELPFILKRMIASKVHVSFLFQNHGMYLDRQQKQRNIISCNFHEYGFFDKKNNTFLMDDNMMSGITMQFAYNQLILMGYKNIQNIFIIRHPNLNRIAQLEYFGTALNLNLVDHFINGMLMDTPYTKIKRGTNYNNMFVNELNIFSVMTEVFLKALYCNNTFIKDSQVDIFLGYSEGRND